MARRLARYGLTLCLLALLGWSGWSLWALAQSPLGVPLVERSHAGMVAAYERALTRAATPEALAARIEERLNEVPRNWAALEALNALATAPGVSLPASLRDRYDALRAEDHGWLAQGRACVACAWDLRQCSLSATLACGIGVHLTVLGDLLSLTREGGQYALGQPVDEVEVTLSFVGLGATGLVLFSGGSSLSVKAGAAFLKTAHRSGRLQPGLLAVFHRAATQGVDWARLPAVRQVDDLAALARPNVLRPALETAESLGQVQARLGTRQTLHLVSYLDSPAEARALARSAQAMGSRTTGALEVLGKSRFLRMGLRLADEVWLLITLLTGAIWGLAGLAGAALGKRLLRGLRHAL